jgi:hypothetical protein
VKTAKPRYVNLRQALFELHMSLNSPRKAGPKWVTYSREQAMAMLEVVKQIRSLEDVRPAASAEDQP